MVKTAKTQPDVDTCRQVAALITDYVSGDLDPATKKAFEAHLRHCRDCVAFLRTYRASVAATRRLTYKALPPALQAKALRVVRKRIARKPARK